MEIRLDAGLSSSTTADIVPVASEVANSVLHGNGSGRGLWPVKQLCDLVQIRTSAAGTVVRLPMNRD